MKFVKVALAVVFVLIFMRCGIDKAKQEYANKRFQLISPDSSNIHFSNNIVATDSLNFFTYQYLYNGAGVGVGDFNGDGLPDIYFNGGRVPGALYINRGDFHFQNITSTAGIFVDNGWPLGVSIVDVNQDGLADIYLSISGPGKKDIYPNKLFINQGLDKNHTPYFKEMAAEYGLADAGQSVQAVFFDYDHDGDLDMYQLTGGGFEKSPVTAYPVAKDGSFRNTDRLYSNDFDMKLGHPVFTNVSKKAGILVEGFGLGVSIVDINEDGWQDIYVTNDYLSSDLLYINNGNGTFSERSQRYFKHTSHFAMGNDIGDINNDGLVDVIALDMLPEERSKRMLMFGPNDYEKYFYAISQGYSHQYMRNTLQLNRGNGKFSEIGQLAGIYKTSWSWAPLFADLDNDGYQDIFISTGFVKDVTDLDFVKFKANTRAAGISNSSIRQMLDSLAVRPGIHSHLYAYKNNGNLSFSDSSKQWGFDTPVYANGAVYADLDNDGDMDMITSNIDEAAQVFRNKTVENTKPGAANFLKVKLIGAANNRMAIGSKIDVKYNQYIQTRNLSVVRGYESSVDATVHFGFGNQTLIDSLIVTWPDGNRSVLPKIKVNQLLTVNYDSSVKNLNTPSLKNTHTLFTEISPATLHIKYKNKQNDFNDFNFERLLPRRYSQGGTGIAVGDINGDGLEDFILGGTYQHGEDFYTQNTNGTFNRHFLSSVNDSAQDAGCLLFDMDCDGDLDFVVVSGGNEFVANDKRYQTRLYENDGRGNFTENSTALPPMHTSGSCISAADYDGDGDLDLFIGGAIVPGLYPQTPVSYILQNNHGKFADVTEIVAPGLKRVGMITCSVWTDIDNDGKIDLMLTGEWMPITIFKNVNGKLINITVEAGLMDTEGWWQSVTSGDFDNDGDMDYILGNWGLNNPYHASVKEPMSMCYNDFDRNGSLDPILCYYEDGKNYPAMSWDLLIEQIPALRKTIPSYAAYAGATLGRILSELDVKGMQTLYCKMLNSVYLQNDGTGKFTVNKLPVEAQFAPIFGMLAEDVNEDGFLDLLCVGNFYGTETVVGRYDASAGLVMYGDGKGNFKSATISETGFIADNDSKALGRVTMANNTSLFLVTQNSDSLKIFRDNKPNRRKNIMPSKNEVFAIVTLVNGSKRKIELGYGSSYLSQSSRSIVIKNNFGHIELYDGKRIKTRVFYF